MATDGQLRICTEVKPRTDLESAARAIDEHPKNKPPYSGQAKTLYTTEEKWSLAILTGKHWADHRKIKIKFMGGVDPRVATKIRDVAQEWLQHINLEFEWAKSVQEEADIRIATDKGDGSWSYLGTDNLGIAQGQPTMNFGWLEPNTDFGEYKRVVLHEFGHMLGFPHEHQLPDADFQWDRDAVYAQYTRPPNSWNKQEIDWNVIDRYSEDQVRGGRFDRESIMLYPIPNSLTIGNYEVGWNTELSEGDKKWAAHIYPKTTEPTEPEEPVDPFANLARVPISKYLVSGHKKECVVTKSRVEVAHSKPIGGVR